MRDGKTFWIIIWLIHRDLEKRGIKIANHAIAGYTNPYQNIIREIE